MRPDSNKVIALAASFLFLFSSGVSFAQAPAAAQGPKVNDALLIDLDVKDVEIKEIGRIFARITGLNVVVGEDVTAKVTFKGSDVEWESALNMILKSANLTYLREGNFLRILSYDKLRQEEQGIPLETRVVPLNFAVANDAIASLGGVLSSRGRATADVKTNSLVITDIPGSIDKTILILNNLDRRTPQVMIEAMLVNVKLTKDEQLGINWLITHKDISTRSIQQSISNTSSAAAIIRYGKTIFPYASLDATIRLWCEEQRAEVLADPRVLTLDGLPATIELTEQVPYQTTHAQEGAIVTSTILKDVGIKLSVTPHISVGGYVSMQINTEQSFRSGTTTDQGPLIDRRKAETTMMAYNGETIVIGGLKNKNKTYTTTKVPLLGDIPFIGRLFKKTVDATTDTELLIFVTPLIVEHADLSEKERRALELIKEPQEKKEACTLKENAPFPLRPPSVTVKYKAPMIK